MLSSTKNLQHTISLDVAQSYVSSLLHTGYYSVAACFQFMKTNVEIVRELRDWSLMRHLLMMFFWSVGPINCQPDLWKCSCYFWSRQLTLGLKAVLLECVHTSYFRACSECQEWSISFSFPCRYPRSESINMTTLRIASSTLKSAILFTEHKDCLPSSF